ncbi:MAG: hypothetical protein QM737_12130 [Ferruginibacter sp.]
MQRSPWRIVLKFLVFGFLILCSVTTYSQVPQVPEEMLPNQIDPKTLSPAQLTSLLSDKNKENQGKDKNADLSKKTRLEKDSIVKDNVRQNEYSADKTYGANVFQYGSITDVNEMSTPPLDYPIGVGDNIVVSLWGAAEFQESYIVAKDGPSFQWDWEK